MSINEKYIKVIKRVVNESVNEYDDNKKGIDVEYFKNPKTKTYDKATKEEWINGYPVIYQITRKESLKSIFKSGFDREFTGSNAGNLYGPGLYSTYQFSSSVNNAGKYGGVFLKILVLSKFKRFLIFDAPLAKKIYGNDWRMENQLLMLFGNDEVEKFKKEGIYDSLVDIHGWHTAPNALSVWRRIGDERLVRYNIGGFIFHGNNDGYVGVIRDFKGIIPIAYSVDGGKTFKDDLFTQETVDAVFYDVDFHTFVGSDIDKVSDTRNVKSGLNKRINDYVLTKTKGGKLNYYNPVNRKFLSPIDFDEASPFRDNGYAYVEITDEKYVEAFGEPFEGYVSKTGISYTDDGNGVVTWKKFENSLRANNVI